MKILSRDFTRVEKLLIVVLALVLVGLAYYQFVYKTTNDAIASAEADAAQARTELDIAEARLAQLKALQKKMDDLEAQGLSWMSSYNNAKAEVAFLNDVLATTIQYSVSFSNVTRNGQQIRRSFSLSYTTPDYDSAQEIIKKLCACENRCLVSNVSCSINAKDGSVSMKQTATFFETMVGGEADAALPADKSKAKK